MLIIELELENVIQRSFFWRKVDYYEIRVRCGASNDIARTWTVQKRFSEMWSIKDKCSSAFPFPPKCGFFSFHTVQFLAERKSKLASWLKSVSGPASHEVSVFFGVNTGTLPTSEYMSTMKVAQCNSGSDCSFEHCIWAHAVSQPFSRWCFSHKKHHGVVKSCLRGETCPTASGCNCCHTKGPCSIHNVYHGYSCSEGSKCGNPKCESSGFCHSAPWCTIHSLWHNSVCVSGINCDDKSCSQCHREQWCTIHKRWDGTACPAVTNCTSFECTNCHDKQWCIIHRRFDGPACPAGTNCTLFECTNCHDKQWCVRHRVRHGQDCHIGDSCSQPNCPFFHNRPWCSTHCFWHLKVCPFGERCHKRNCELCHPGNYCDLHSIFHGSCCSLRTGCKDKDCDLRHDKSWCATCQRWDGACQRHEHKLVREVVGLRSEELECDLCYMSIDMGDTAYLCRRDACNEYAECLSCASTSNSGRSGDCFNDVKCRKVDCRFSHSRSFCIHHQLWHGGCNLCYESCGNVNCVDYHKSEWCWNCSMHHGDCTAKYCSDDCSDSNCVRIHSDSWCGNCNQHHGNCSNEICNLDNDCEYKYCIHEHSSAWCSIHSQYHAPCSHNHKLVRRRFKEFCCSLCSKTYNSFDIAFVCSKCNYYECDTCTDDTLSTVQDSCWNGDSCKVAKCRFSHEKAWCYEAEMWHQKEEKYRSGMFSSKFSCDAC